MPVTNNLLVWLEADAGVTTISTYAGYVTSWADQATTIGGANNAAQTEAARYPTLVENGSPLGNLPVIRFNKTTIDNSGSPPIDPTGIGDFLQINSHSAFNTQTLSWFAVYSRAGAPAGDPGCVLFSRYSVADVAMTWTATDGKYDVSMLDSGFARKDVTFPASSPMNKFVYSSAVWNGTGAVVNGNAAATLGGWLDSTAGTAATGVDFNPSGHQRSAIGGFVSYLYGDVAEILIYDTALSAADRMAVEGYLHQKWFTAVPEPSSLVLLGIGLAGLAVLRIGAEIKPGLTWIGRL